jgi:hypothetical protein
VAKKLKSLGEPEPNGHPIAELPAPELPPEPPREAPPTEKAQPIHQFRIRNIRAAIWKNERPDGSPWYAVTFSRSWRDEGGNWHTADSFAGADLLILSELARQAFGWVIATTQSDTPF